MGEAEQADQAGQAGSPRRRVRDLTREDTTVSMLRSTLFLREEQARQRVRAALALTTRFPQTLLALSEGRIDLAKAILIATLGDPMGDHQYALAVMAGLSPEEAERVVRAVCGRLEEHILKRAGIQPLDNLRDCLHRAVHRLDPDYADTAAKERLGRRRVTYRANPGDDTGDLYAHLGAAEAQGIYSVLDAYARAARHTGSKRTLDELRADALTYLILYGHLPDGTALPTQAKTAAAQGPTTTQAASADRATSGGRGAAGGRAASGDPATSADPDALAGPATAAVLADASDENVTVLPEVDRITGDLRPTLPRSRPPTQNPTTADPPPKASPGNTPPGNDSPLKDSALKDSPGNTPPGNDSPPKDAPLTDSPGDGPPSVPIEAVSDAFLSGKAFSHSGLRAHVQITMSLDTLLGLDDDAADLTGHGPITAQTARDLAYSLGSTWRRLVTDPVSGTLLDYGRTTYKPPAALADHVRARDVTCRTPYCTRPAASSDLDHLIAWPVGATSEENLHTKCRLELGRTGARCWPFGQSVSPARPPNPPCDSHRNGLSMCLSR